MHDNNLISCITFDIPLQKVLIHHTTLTLSCLVLSYLVKPPDLMYGLFQVFLFFTVLLSYAVGLLVAFYDTYGLRRVVIFRIFIHHHMDNRSSYAYKKIQNLYDSVTVYMKFT